MENECFVLLRKAVNLFEGKRLAQEDFGRYPSKDELQLEIEEYIKKQTGEENIYPDYLQEYKSGGSVKSDEIDDIAWDIGLQKGLIKNNNWIDDMSKSKAMDLAKIEFMAKGGKTGLDGIDWIMTGKMK